MTNATHRQDLHSRQRVAAETQKRRRHLRTWLSWAAGVAVVAIIGGMLLTSQTTSATTSKTAPDFTLPTTSDTTVTLSKLRGKPVLLYFNEGAGCGACLMQMGEIEKNEADFNALGITVLPIVMNTKVDITTDMSHYGVNSGVPKTLIQYLIRWVIATGQFSDVCAEVLGSVLDTEISPELVPPGADGQVQSTESLVGPYELNDFFLHHVTRFGQRPSKVAFLAWHAWKDAGVGMWPAGFPQDAKNAYDLRAIAGWLDKFCARFFGFSQFKRSALPNGPKVSSAGALSPRGDWRAPSDAVATVWRDELRDNLPDDIAREVFGDAPA